MPTSTLTSLARKAGVTAAALAVGAGLAVTGVAPAHASASGCTTLPGLSIRGSKTGLVCISVVGQGTYIDHVTGDAVRATGITNGQLRITGFDSAGRQRGQFLGPFHYGTTVHQSFTYNFRANFPELRGGRICVSLVESGVARPGACEAIY